MTVTHLALTRQVGEPDATIKHNREPAGVSSRKGPEYPQGLWYREP